jgi:hypothetical protein
MRRRIIRLALVAVLSLALVAVLSVALGAPASADVAQLHAVRDAMGRDNPLTVLPNVFRTPTATSRLLTP